MGRQLPSVSVVIPTRDRPAPLLRLLDGLCAQTGIDLRRVEVVIVCDGIGDPSFEAAQRGWYPMRLRLAQQQRQGAAAARNHGLALCAGELVVFLDDDVVPDPRLLTRHQQAHADDDELVAIGPLLPPAGRSAPWVRWEGGAAARRQEAMATGQWPAAPHQFRAGNASVRRRHLVDAFGFDVAFPRGEDVELAFRLRDRGLHFRFLPDATVQHVVERSYVAFIEAADAYGRFEVRVGRDRGHRDLLDGMVREFNELSPPARWLLRTTVRRPALAHVTAALARPVALLAERAHAPRLGGAALTAAFSSARLAGFAAEIGGPRPALALLDGRHRWPADATVAPAQEAAEQPPPGE